MSEEPISTEAREAAAGLPTPASRGVVAEPSWFERLSQAKLSPLIVIGFFDCLALMSAAATGVSYLVHHLARH